MQSAHLRITEIFYSLQGESSYVGIPTVFVRLTGCPLRCGYCDTAYAFHHGKVMSFAEIMTAINQYHCRYICITGGEPLAQPNVLTFLDELVIQGFEVSLETSGAIAIDKVNTAVKRIMDLKTPDSGEMSRNLYSNIDHLTSHDEVKFVICSQADYEWAKRVIQQYHLDTICTILFSPCYGTLEPRVLADWLLADKLTVRFQMELHKVIWGDIPGK